MTAVLIVLAIVLTVSAFFIKDFLADFQVVIVEEEGSHQTDNLQTASNDQWAALYFFFVAGLTWLMACLSYWTKSL